MGRRIHFIGVGGYSMSGLAEVLAARGESVSGSDMKASSRTDRLILRGIPVAIGHREENQAGADVVVYNSDVPEENPELVAAKRRGAVLLHRSDILASLLSEGKAICVTGTHGKTTTSTLTGHILIHAGLDPTVLVGGEVDAWGGGARIGRGEWLVAEADESDGSFLKYKPQIGVVTNIEPEHLEHYGGRFENVIGAVKTFLDHLQPGGTAVLCADDPRLVSMEIPPGRERILYGLGRDAGLTTRNIRTTRSGHSFDVVQNGQRLGRALIPIPGRHNVQNALGALGAAMAAGVSFDAAREALAAFKNAHRRFEVHFRGRGMVVVDDYAHHPTEIRAVLKAARELRPKRLIVAFQPQRYSRTQSLFPAFVEAFDEADVVFLLDIYSPPGESPIPGVTSEELARQVLLRTGKSVVHLKTPEDLVTVAEPMLGPGDLFITLGAGDIFKAAERLAEDLGRAV